MSLTQYNDRKIWECQENRIVAGHIEHFLGRIYLGGEHENRPKRNYQ